MLFSALLIGLLQFQGAPDLAATAPDVAATGEADGGVPALAGADGGESPGFFARMQKLADRAGIDGGTVKTAAFALGDKLVSMHDAKEKEASDAAAAAAASAPPPGTRGGGVALHGFRVPAPARAPAAISLRGFDQPAAARTPEKASVSMRKAPVKTAARPPLKKKPRQPLRLSASRSSRASSDR